MNRIDDSKRIEANEKIAQLLSEPNGLQKIAADVLPDLIKETRDYEGFCRKVLIVDPITKDDIVKDEKGQFFKQYPKDIGSGAAFYGEEVDAPQYKIDGELINVPILTLVSDESTIDKKRLLIERLDYLERAKNKAGQAIAMLEDYKVLAITETIIMGNGTVKAPQYTTQVATVAATTLSKAHLVSLKKTHSRHDLETAAFVLNPATLDDILGWDDTEVDETTRRELLESGVRYTIWKNISLIPSRLIPMTLVYAYAAKEYTGVIPELAGIDVELTNTPNRLIKGLFLYEFLGFAIVNHKAVGKLILGFQAGDDMINVYTQPKEGVQID